MSVTSASKVGEIVVNSIPAKYECSKMISDLLSDLPDLLTVKIPSESTLGFIAASQNAPDASDAVLWVELSGTGVPVSIRYYQDGAWRALWHQLRNPQWFEGDWITRQDTLESQGYLLADKASGGVDLTHLFEQTATSPVNYSTWAMYYVGRQLVRNP